MDYVRTLEDGTVEVGIPRKRRTGASLIHAFAQAAQLIRKTESGAPIGGLVCPGFKWVYWSYLNDHVACERCGTTLATPSALDPTELAIRYLIPFATDHKGCKKEDV